MTVLAYHWLVAEAAAWPLASEASFATGMTAFQRPRPGIFDGPTAALASSLEEHLRPIARGLSLESIRQLRNYAWFGDGESSHEPIHAYTLGAYLARLAGDHLEHRGSTVGLRAQEEMSDLAGRWRWLSLAFPADTLIAALSASKGLPPADHVDLAPSVLAKHLLEQPAAETHLHVGAASSFAMLWSAMARSIGSPEYQGDQLLRQKPAPFGNGKAFAMRLIETFISRLLLAGHLRLRRYGGATSFSDWARATFPSIATAMGWSSAAAGASALGVIVRSMMSAGRSFDWAVLRLHYRCLMNNGTRPPAADPQHPFGSDPLSSAYDCSVSPESLFQHEALQYIGCGRIPGPGAEDRDFQTLFWQYIRIRAICFRHLVEQPGTAGLDWFGRHYYRISPLRAGIEPVLYRRALEVESRGIRLGALEVRTSPPNDWSTLHRMLKDIAAQAAGFARDAIATARQPGEIGLILHFIKSAERGRGKEKALHGDPTSYLYGCRYGEWYHARLREALAVTRVLRQRPEMLILLRGIDAANAELSVPNWVLLPLLRKVITASHAAAAHLRVTHPQLDVRPMQTTVHAGEDYRTPLEGLRRIHELIEHDAIGSGDRIGHGVALGYDVADWRRRVGGVFTQPREERLDDLLWILGRVCSRDLASATKQESMIRDEATQLARVIYGDGVTLDCVMEARARRHQPEILEYLGYPFMGHRRGRVVRGWRGVLLRHLTDPHAFSLGSQSIRITIDDHEVEVIVALQHWLRQVVSKMDVTVESNPSSNLLIGDLIDLQSHPAFRLQPIDGKSDEPRVLLSINTDNPVTFASCLADEFAHIYHALLRNPSITADQALSWVVRRRDDGWRSRFTVAASAQPDILESLAHR